MGSRRSARVPASDEPRGWTEAAEVHADNVSVNIISPGLVATPGVIFHKLINESNKDRVTSVEQMADACLRLSYSPVSEISGRINYADKMIDEFSLEPTDVGLGATVREIRRGCCVDPLRSQFIVRSQVVNALRKAAETELFDAREYRPVIRVMFVLSFP